MPAITRWSSSAALIGVLLPFSSDASVAPESASLIGSTPSSASSGGLSSSLTVVSVIRPKRRASLRDYVQASGELGYFQHRFAVYDREGKPCPGCDCAGGIRRIVQSNRSTFYCPRRQR